jgi:hypothetical protein
LRAARLAQFSLKFGHLFPWAKYRFNLRVHHRVILASGAAVANIHKHAGA